MDGRGLRDEIIAGLRATLAGLGHPPVCLATVVVGEDRAARANAQAKHRAAAAAGIRWRHTPLGSATTEGELRGVVRGLVADPAVHGVFVQLPLPIGLPEDAILDEVPPAKDVDGLSAASIARLVLDRGGHAPCTAEAVLRLLGRYEVGLSGRRAVVVGRSARLAVPLALMLGRAGCGAVTLVDPEAPDLADVCRGADVVVAAADRPHLIGAEHLRPGAAVVDAGVTRRASGVVGDVDVERVRGVAGRVAPMPGGVGPVTVACLLEHTLAAARHLGAC